MVSSSTGENEAMFFLSLLSLAYYVALKGGNSSAYLCSAYCCTLLFMLSLAYTLMGDHAVWLRLGLAPPLFQQFQMCKYRTPRYRFDVRRA